MQNLRVPAWEATLLLRGWCQEGGLFPGSPESQTWSSREEESGGPPQVPPKSAFLLERELGNLTLNQGGPGSGSSSGEGGGSLSVLPWMVGPGWGVQLAEGRTKPPSPIYRFYPHFTGGETEAVRLSHTANRGLTVSDEPIAVVSVASVPLSSGGLGGSVVAQRTPP